MLHTEVGLQADAIRDDHDDQRADDGVARLASPTEQRRASDDRGSHGKQQDVAGTEVELGTTGARGPEDSAERSERGVDRERCDLDVADVDTGAPGCFLVAAGSEEVASPSRLREGDGA